MAAHAEDRPVQERSLATRAALLDAAIECLVDRGYAATTTIETARRAGVSRGAQLHHFPTKAQLLATAVEHLFDRRREEFLEAFAAIDPETDRLDAALDLLWSMFQGPAFVAWTELWVAARTDPELAATVVAVERRFTAETRTMFAELFPAAPGADALVSDMARDFAFAVVGGVALQRLFPHGERPASDYLDALKHVFRLAGLER
ncbi:MAG TPA: TetR family transcriptional regulator [Thermoleophilaceae bacterium]|nr:TetR family transcriptional regulator [Thermoleophilaceae bacterium]